MRKLSVLCLLINLMSQIVLGNGTGADVSTLQLVQIVFRHGDRNPLTTYPTDPNDKESNWPEGYGQLTNLGKRQLYDFGVYLRSRYDGFLSQTYFVNDALVWSSDNDRTIMSAMAALAGLYPPQNGNEDKWNPDVNFQLVPVHTIPKKIDRFLDTERESCPNFNRVVGKFIKTSKYMNDLNKESQKLLKQLSSDSGLKITFVNDLVYKLHDTLSVQEARNITIPDWAVPLMEADSEFKKIVYKCLDAFSLTPELRRLYSGELVKELLKNMKNKLSGQSQLRMIMFSAHDLTISNLMNTMGIYNYEMPPYAASLLFELHKTQDSAEYHVKVFYRNDTNAEPYDMEMPECGGGPSCELSKLEQLMSPVISEDWDAECQVQPKVLTNSVPSAANSTNASTNNNANEIANSSSYLNTNFSWLAIIILSLTIRFGDNFSKL